RPPYTTLFRSHHGCYRAASKPQTHGRTTCPRTGDSFGTAHRNMHAAKLYSVRHHSDGACLVTWLNAASTYNSIWQPTRKHQGEHHERHPTIPHRSVR